MKKRTGIVVDYFGVFNDLEKALNFDESVREESLIDWEKLRETVLGEVARCLETFTGIDIRDTRECLLAALRRLREPDTAKSFGQGFRSLDGSGKQSRRIHACIRTAESTTGCGASTSHIAGASTEFATRTASCRRRRRS